MSNESLLLNWEVKRRQLIYLLFFFYMVLNVTCTKKEKCYDVSNPVCENYNPCSLRSPVTAEFAIGQIYSANVIHPADKYNEVFIEDSIFPNNCSISFRAKEMDAKYTWYLGSEEINTRTFARVFYKLPLGKYTVTLIVEKAPDLKCFPNDDGRDTVVKNFYIVRYCDLNTTGLYKGVIDDNKDSVYWRFDMCTLKFNTFIDSNSIIDYCGDTYLILSGAINESINPHKDSIRVDPVNLTIDTYIVSNNVAYLGWEKSGGYCFGVGNAEIKINKDKTVEFGYRTMCKYHTFKGRKL